MYFMYLIQSIKNRKVYVGLTGKQPVDRLREHNAGSSAWTKHNGPFKLIYFESFVCKEDARRRELFYKSGIGKQLRKIIVKHVKPGCGAIG